MSLVTRGMGAPPLLVTRGFGASGGVGAILREVVRLVSGFVQRFELRSRWQ